MGCGEESPPPARETANPGKTYISMYKRVMWFRPFT